MKKSKVYTNTTRTPPKKLKIICGWDEVIQPCEPYALWMAVKKENEKSNFTDFFQGFWAYKPETEKGWNIDSYTGQKEEYEIELSTSKPWYCPLNTNEVGEYDLKKFCADCKKLGEIKEEEKDHHCHLGEDEMLKLNVLLPKGDKPLWYQLGAC